MAGFRFLQTIETAGNNAKSGLKKLDQQSKSFLTFDAGVSLIPVIIKGRFEIRISPGISLTHRNEVIPLKAFEFKNLPTLVQNEYRSQWIIGGFFNVGFVYGFKTNWLIELRGQVHKFKNTGGVFDIGLSLGKKF